MVNLSETNSESIEQSFGIETGRYRKSDGQFAEGSPPTDYDADSDRFRARDGKFKNRSKDLGMFTEWDAPADDAATDFAAEAPSDGTAPGFGDVDKDPFDF